MTTLRLLAAGLLLAGVSTGCSDDKKDDDSGSSSAPSQADCEAIITACHSKDDGMQGEISKCHEDAHHGDDHGDYSMCANRDACVALCEAAPDLGSGGTGHHHSGGTGGHTHAGGAAGHSHAGGTGGHSHAGGAGGHMHSVGGAHSG